MPNFTDRIIPCFNEPSTARGEFHVPRHQVSETRDSIDIEVFVPDVSPEAVELVVEENRLVVTALRHRHVRMNWQAASLETVQHDYQLRVILGEETDLKSIWAVHRDGILTVHLKKTLPLIPAEGTAERVDGRSAA